MQEKWLYKAIPNLLGGIDKSKQPDALADNQCVTLRDVKITDDMLVSSNGYTQYGTSTGTGGKFTPVIQTPYQFDRRDGTSELIAITLTDVQKYNTSLSKWLPVAGPLHTTTTAAYVAGATVIAITVDPSTGFVIGNTFCIVLDNTDLHITTITNIAGLNITIATGIPTGRTVALGARVFKPKILSGDITKRVSIVTVPGSDWMVFTNGVQTTLYWDGTSVEDVPNLPSAGDTICKAVALYNTALFLIGTTEGGVSYPQRVRRSNQTDPTDWTGGTAGYDDLLDSSYPVVCAHILGPYLIVYKSRGIIRCSFIGSSGLNYQYETTITHEGVITPLSVVTVKDKHIFVGHNNVYEYAGDFTIRPIGDQIRTTLFGSGAYVSSKYDYIISMIYIEAFDELWIFYHSQLITYSGCTDAFRYHVKLNIWYESHFETPIYGLSVYKSGSPGGELNFHLCDYQNHKVYAYDNSVYTRMDGSATPFIVETKDYIMADGRFRFDMIEMNIKGTGILLEYSTDAGTTYTTMATITQATQSKVRVHKQFVCDKVRFRWTGTASNFKLSWAGFSYKIENLYISGSNTY